MKELALLDSTFLEAALAESRRIDDGGERAKALVKLALHLEASLQEGALTEVLKIAADVEDPGTQKSILTTAAPLMDTSRSTEVAPLDSSLATQDQHAALDSSQTTQDQHAAFKHALADARALPDNDERALRLSELISGSGNQVSDDLLLEVLTAVCSASNPFFLGSAFRRVIARLPDSLVPSALDQICAASDQPRGYGLAAITPRLPESLVTKAFHAATSIPLLWPRCVALGAVSQRLPEGQRSDVLDTTITVIRGTVSVEWLGPTLALLAPHLPAPLAWMGLDALRQAPPEGNVADSCHRLICRLVELGYAEELIDVMLAADSKWWLRRVETLEVLIGALPPSSILRAFRLYQPDRLRDDDAAVLRVFSVALATSPVQVLYPLLQRLLRQRVVGGRWSIVPALPALEPLLLSIGGPGAIVETVTALIDVGRRWP